MGATRSPLRIRLSAHVSQADRRNCEFHRYIDDRGLRFTDLEIRELKDCVDEEQALLAYDTLNTAMQTQEPRKLNYDDVPDELLLKLGETDDTKLARHYRVPLHKVRNARSKLRISPSDKRGQYTHIDWEEYDQYLGTMTDTSLAKKIGCSFGAVADRRKLKDIPPHGGTRKGIGNVSEEMGKEMAAEYASTGKTQFDVAKEYGVSQRTVSTYHQKYNK